MRPRQALGQNFVVDPNTVRRMVRLAEVQIEDRILEIGPGLGSLTAGLAQAASEVVALEVDATLIPALEESVSSFGNVRLVVGDAMAVDYDDLLGNRSYRMVSNLPYNIATPLVGRLLEEVPQVRDLHFMAQLEVAQRLTAEVGSRAYGIPSVLVNYFAEGSLVGKVPASVFWPPPKVESAIVRMVRREPPVSLPWRDIEVVVKAAFGQRRKTLRNSLASGLGLPASQVQQALQKAGVDPRRRAETLNLEEFAAVARALR